MYCINLSKRLNGKLRCKLLKQQITLEQCKKCLKMQPRVNQPINKKSNKQQKLEKSRYSILTNDLKHCYICYEQDESLIPKDDLHEIYGGRNRTRSIKNGFVAPLCRKHHEDEIILEYLKRLCQITYEENHTREEFLKIIDKNYL